MSKARQDRNQGFSLVELMVVVAILAILVTVGMVSYRRYTIHAHSSEAMLMLATIHQRQDSYRAEFSQYCDVSSSSHDGSSGSTAGSWPTSAPGRTAVVWTAGLPAEWTSLGIATSGPVYYRYSTVAGNPGVIPNAIGGSDLNYGASPNHDAWWVADAIGDLDGNGTYSTYEATSLNGAIWTNNAD